MSILRNLIGRYFKQENSEKKKIEKIMM